MAEDKTLLYVMMFLQLAVVIPLIVGIINRKRLDLFGTYIVLALFASFLADAIGTITAFVIQSNVVVQFCYTIVHSVFIGLAWFMAMEFGKEAKLFIVISTIVTILLILSFWFLNMDVSLAGYTNLLFTLILGLFYYYSKVSQSSMSDFLLEPKFIIASAFILYCLSVMIIFAAVSYVDQDQFPYIWSFKQVFYIIFNIIMAYGLSMYSKKNIKKWIQES